MEPIISQEKVEDSRPIIDHGRLDPVALEALKLQHEYVGIVQVWGDSNEKERHRHFCYVKKPSIDVFAQVMSMTETDPISANKVLLASVFLAGDERIKTHVDLFVGATRALRTLVPSREGELSQA
jgi:hypothetical protein